MVAASAELRYVLPGRAFVTREPDRGSGPDDGEGRRIAAGRRLFARPVRFLLGAAEHGQLPATQLPEIAFAGRSNVGKSSLLNALLGRRQLARTSRTPGRTQELNFFELDGRLLLVDLPGYGYAQAPKARVEAWTRLVRDYLRGRPNLLRVCLLIDARRGIGTRDLEIMDLLAEAAVPFQIVLTKCDLLKPVELETRVAGLRSFARRRRAAVPEPIATSARTGLGIAELRASLAELLRDSREQAA